MKDQDYFTTKEEKCLHCNLEPIVYAGEYCSQECMRASEEEETDRQLELV